MRPEIQGLRGIAVASVVVFHIWPQALPGGYIGVDVFFVISGYLITGLLARMAGDGHISLVAFYSRRVRRLLPTALLALVATLAGTLLFLSKARWEETVMQVAASARRFGQPARTGLLVALGLIFAGSLAASVLITRTDPAAAYFVTHTRLWELALGGLLALATRQGEPGLPLRPVMAVAGLGAIAISALLFSASTPFPGAYALLPTLGTVLVIAAGDVRIGRFGGLNIPVLRYIGDRSYSIYLWHWPLITFYAVHHPVIGLTEGAGLIAVMLLISHLSYRYVEQRYRQPRTRLEWKPLTYGTAAVCLCVAASGGFGYFLSRQAVDTALIGTPNYPGPAALLSNAFVPDGVEPLPPLGQLGRDVPIVYRLKCHQGQDSTEPVGCKLGDPNGATTIVVTGDSHAAQWIPAVDKIARDRKWKLVTFTKAACPMSRVTMTDGGKPYPECAQWRENVIVEIRKLKPDVVITSQSSCGSIPQEAMIEGLRSVWIELGARIVTIRNTPYSKFDPGDCLAADPKKCINAREDIERADIFALAAVPMRDVTVVDMNDGLCSRDSCPAMVGNIIVWRDNHHITASYALALAPYLAKAAGF